MKIGVLGSGGVAKVLAGGLLKHGHEVKLGSRTAEKLGEWAAENPTASIGSFAEAAGFGELVVLAVKGSAASEALRLAGAKNLAGKPVMDTTNPIADGPPVNGVLQFFTDHQESLMEKLQKEFPEAHFVKAFNSVGIPCMVNPKFAGGKPTMFICGNDDGAKRAVSGILDQFGWETAEGGRRKRRGPSSRCACCGAFRGSRGTSGRTHSSCCGRNLCWGGIGAPSDMRPLHARESRPGVRGGNSSGLDCGRSGGVSGVGAELYSNLRFVGFRHCWRLDAQGVFLGFG